MRRTTSLLIVVFYLALAVAGDVHIGACASAVCETMQSNESQKTVIAAEEPEASYPKDREARRAKNIRYNKGGNDLTVPRASDSEIFFEQRWLAVDFIPAAESAVVVTGRVVKVQPYLSGDRSRIYTEITVAVDDLLKRDRDSRLSVSNTVVIDRLGGALKLKTGDVVRDEIHIDNLGKPQLGKRYVFFAERVNDGSDLSLIKSYESINGQVFTNDSGSGRLISSLPGVPQAWADEAVFLKAVRQVIASTAGTGARKQ